MTSFGEGAVDRGGRLTRNLMLGGAPAEEKQYPSHAARLPCGRTGKGIPLERTDPIVEYRIRVITTGLILSWLGWVLFTLWAFVSHDSVVVAIIEVAAALVGLLVLSFAPWRRLMSSGLADIMFMTWSVLALVMILTVEFSNDRMPSGIGFLIVTFFAAATLMSNLGLITIGLLSVVVYGVALATHEGIDTLLFTGSVVLFLVAVLFVLLLAIGIRTQLEQTAAAYRSMAEREAVLTRREREMSQLYDVSRTNRAGTKLDDVRPELSGRV